MGASKFIANSLVAASCLITCGALSEEPTKEPIDIAADAVQRFQPIKISCQMSSDSILGDAELHAALAYDIEGRDHAIHDLYAGDIAFGRGYQFIQSDTDKESCQFQFPGRLKFYHPSENKPEVYLVIKLKDQASAYLLTYTQDGYSYEEITSHPNRPAHYVVGIKNSPAIELKKLSSSFGITKVTVSIN